MSTAIWQAQWQKACAQQDHQKAYLYAQHLLQQDPQQLQWLKAMGLALRQLGYLITAQKLLQLYQQQNPQDNSIDPGLFDSIPTPKAISGPPHTSVVVAITQESAWNQTLLYGLLKTPELNELWCIGPNHGPLREWLQHQGKQHPQIRLLLFAEPEHPACLNQALDLCCGPYVLLLKDQAAVSQGWLSRLQQELQRNERQVLGWQTEQWPAVDPLCNEILSSNEAFFEEFTQQWAKKYCEPAYFVETLALGGWMMAKETFYQIGGIACDIPLEPHGVKEWNQRAHRIGIPVRCLPAVYTLSQWQVDPQTMLRYEHNFLPRRNCHDHWHVTRRGPQDAKSVEPECDSNNGGRSH